jgi:hypothetical protein
VLHRIFAQFPGETADETDQSQADVERFREFLSRANSPEGVRSTVLKGIERKARRNGPTYWFTIPIGPADTVRGWARRYSVGFEVSPEQLQVHRDRLESFLRDLKLGTIHERG